MSSSIPTMPFSISRARWKSGGHAYAPWLQYYTEYEIRNNRLLDLRFTIVCWPECQLRLGQWKYLMLNAEGRNVRDVNYD